MAGRVKFWRAAAVIFTLINVGGAFYAIANGEFMHATVHTGLLVGTYAIWQSGRRKNESAKIQPQFDDELRRLQGSLDAIALEVERIGEGQRFINKLQSQHGGADDSETQIGRVPAVLPEEESEDGKAEKPRDIQEPRSGGKT